MQTPAFIQSEREEALIEQVNWLRQSADTPVEFFARTLRVERPVFAAWQAREGDLPPEKLIELRSLWRTIRRLLSFFNDDAQVFRRMLEEPVESQHAMQRSPLMPPWAGSTLRAFLETGGSDAVERVSRWIGVLRFGEPYSRATGNEVWPQLFRQA